MICKKTEDEEENVISVQLNLPLSYNKKRHLEQIEGINCISQSWRMKERMKTVSVALVLCLNVGVDPPDVVKIQPCAKLECWIDTSSVSAAKALELVGGNLQQQYERWQPRARYKQSLDPTVDDVKKLCTSLRRNAKEERVLFHYNGHGVPRPTVNGEIWVFNRNYTQYIPLSIYDLQTWMGAPSIYVYDCSNAGIIVNSFNTFAEQHEREYEKMTANRKSPSLTGVNNVGVGGEGAGGLPPNTISYKNCIQLAACSANQILPMNPQLPADLFTACLTTPIKIALKWFMLQQTASLVPHVSQDLIDRIPGKINDRRTMQGELNWIFTAITDTIAWNLLPRDLFQKLFRQDLLVASLFRNFLLAERILRSYDCTPIASPALPPSFRHPMWSAWDLSLDVALSQLPDILQNKKAYVHSSFFEEQLTAFQVWLEGSNEKRSPPEQLPIVLQVLLSQVHRYRALELLGRFLDLGPWAVNLALSVGIFPYVLKLLQSSAKELRPFLVFIWAKILAVDNTCQIDLIREQGHKYFLEALQDPNQTVVFNNSYSMFAAFVLASIVHNFPLGQSSALQGKLISFTLIQLNDANPMMRQWLAICLGNLWQNYEEARWSGVRDMANDKLYPLLEDPVPEVRAAAVYALGTFISSVEQRTEHANTIDRAVALQLLTTVGYDVSPLVRMELIKALQWMVIIFESSFVSIFLKEVVSGGHNGHGHHGSHFQTSSLERMKRVSSSSSIMTIDHRQSVAAAVAVGTTNLASGGSSWLYNPSINVSVYMRFWQFFYRMSHDPYPRVARLAQKVIEHIKGQATLLIQAKEAIAAELNATGSSIRHSNPSLSVSLPPSPNTRTSYMPGAGGASNNFVNAEVLAAKIQNSHASGVVNIIGNSPPPQWRGGVKPPTGSNSPKPVNSPSNASGTRIRAPIHNQTMQLNEETATANRAAHTSTSTTATAVSQGSITGGRLSGSNEPVSTKLKPIVTTNFIDWSISFIARPSRYFCDYEATNTGGVPTSASCFTSFYTTLMGRKASSFQYQHPQYDQTGPVSSSTAYSLDTSVDEADRSWSADLNSSVSSDTEDLTTRYADLQEDYRKQRDCAADSSYQPRLEYSWGGRTQMAPSLVKLHPFQTEIVVAYRDKVMLSNWETGVIQSFLPTRQQISPRHLGSSTSNLSAVGHHYTMGSSPDSRRLSQPHYATESGMGSLGNLAASSNGYVTSIDFINPHYRTLLMVSHSDYVVRIWRQMVHQPGAGSTTVDKFTSNDDDHLVTAWVAFNEQTDLVRPTTLCGGNFITQWHQRTHTVFAGGVTKFIRLWNAEREMKEADYPTGSDHPISLLSCPPGEVNLFATGYGDGCVRIYDRRIPVNEAKVLSFHEHSEGLIELCMKNDTVVSACSQGSVKICDTRRPAVLHQWTAADKPVTVNVHPELNFIACGKQSINVFDTFGRQVTTVRSNDGIMRSSRMAMTTCLSFHPYRMCLAAGFADHTVSVFTAAPRL